MYTVDAGRFRQAMREKGYTSVEALARTLGIHRNTIHHYLSGRGLLPKNFEKVLRALAMQPGDLLIERDTRSSRMTPIAPVIDQLHLAFPAMSFVLFGSRGGGRHRPYSDWDIGVFSRHGLAHATFRAMRRAVDTLAEDLPVRVDLVNLNRADPAFLRNAARQWSFLTGHQQDWIVLQQQAAL